MGDFEAAPPVGVIFPGEDALNGLGATGSGLDQGFQGLAKLAESWVGMLAMLDRRPIEPIQGRGQFENLAAGFQKIALENHHRVTLAGHWSTPLQAWRV